MESKVQQAAKAKIIELLKEYDVSYIDYDAREDEYSIRLEKKEDAAETTKIFADGKEINSF